MDIKNNRSFKSRYFAFVFYMIIVSGNIKYTTEF